MDKVCSLHGKLKVHTNSGWKTLKEETTWTSEV